MNARILRPEEWSRLEKPQIPTLIPYVRPQDMAVVAVEDGDKLVACMSAYQATHFETLWVDPAYRGNAGAVRPLLRYATAIADAWGARWAFAGVESDQMRGFLKRLGGVKVPLDFYALSLRNEERETWQSQSQPSPQ